MKPRRLPRLSCKEEKITRISYAIGFLVGSGGMSFNNIKDVYKLVTKGVYERRATIKKARGKS